MSFGRLPPSWTLTVCSADILCYLPQCTCEEMHNACKLNLFVKTVGEHTRKMSSLTNFSLTRLFPYEAPTWAQQLKGIPSHKLKVNSNWFPNARVVLSSFEKNPLGKFFTWFYVLPQSACVLIAILFAFSWLTCPLRYTNGIYLGCQRTFKSS